MKNNKDLNYSMAFPQTRMRRNRLKSWSRKLMKENILSASDLILPIFITDSNKKTPITSMPGIARIPLEQVSDIIGHADELRIQAVALFPEISSNLKDVMGSEALNKNNLVCRTVEKIKKQVPNIGIICDVALDPYTSHGHDGLLSDNPKDPEILNDETIKVLINQSIIQAQAGADIIAPSDMMDGRIGAIRNALDQADFKNTQIMSYAAKYASAFYGPFRDAIGSNKTLMGNKKTYQMDYSNSNEALREVALDIKEGADIIMIKPGMPYLDILSRVKSTFLMPTFVYQVSGEYSMLSVAADNNFFDRNAVIMESLTCFKRAGADGILTYFALEAAQILKEG